MKTMAFSVFDSKAESFAPPFFMQREGEAVRALARIANDTNTTVGRFPEDYTLYHLGFFDDYTGEFETVKAKSICIASSLVKVDFNGVVEGNGKKESKVEVLK